MRRFRKASCFSMVLVLCCILVFVPKILAAKSQIKINERVPNFVLESADGIQYELKKMKKKTVILIMAPRKVEDDRNRWVKMLLKSFPQNDSLQIFSVLDMRGIPFFITDDFVREKVKEKQDKHPVTILMDWKQKVNNLFGANEKETDIFVIGAGGVLVSHQVGTYSEHKLNCIKKRN